MTNHVADSPPATDRIVTVSAIQFACTSSVQANLMKAEQLVRAAAEGGANIVLLQELFSSPYFPIDQVECLHYSSENNENNELLKKFASLASELGIVLPISFYERSKYVIISSFQFAICFPLSLPHLSLSLSFCF